MRANLQQTSAQGAELSEANLNQAKLKEANFSEANLEQANLESTELNKANFSGSNLGKANLSRSNFKGTILTRSNLKGAYLLLTNKLNNTQIKSACNWELAIYKGDYDQETRKWIVDEKANQEFIQQLKQHKASEPQLPVDCSRWE